MTDNDVLRAISVRAWTTNRGRAAQLDEIVADLRDVGSISAERHQLAASLAHQLLGSAGTFGHEAVSAPARRLEVLLAGLPSERPVALHQGDELAALVREVRKSLEHEPPVDD